MRYRVAVVQLLQSLLFQGDRGEALAAVVAFPVSFGRPLLPTTARSLLLVAAPLLQLPLVGPLRLLSLILLLLPLAASLHLPPVALLPPPVKLLLSPSAGLLRSRRSHHVKLLVLFPVLLRLS